MAYFPDKQKIKQEIQEQVVEFDLSCDHLTTANFFEPNVAYVRDNTTRETWTNNSGVFARPVPMQMPVMGKAKLQLKTYFCPYRILSPQWQDFITRTPHVPANQSSVVTVKEMPYFKMSSMIAFFETSSCSTPTTGNDWDFIDGDGSKFKLTAYGRHCKKILNQLRYKIYWGRAKNDTTPERHWNALRLLAFAKIYLDYYYSSQYAYVLVNAIDVEQIFKRDATAAYELTTADIGHIFSLTRYAYYSEDYFVSQWDNPTSPNNVTTSFGTLTMVDITASGTTLTNGKVEIQQSATQNEYGTPYLTPANKSGTTFITQYAIDSLKACTDYVHRYSMAGVRAIDRYLSRFGVLLTSEKLQRSEFMGTQETNMQFGAVMSTAETSQAMVGDYAGQGIINSDGQQHNEFQLEDKEEMGCIMQIFTINPKIGYWQGMARENMRSDPESYFNGVFDSLGTQATSAAEVYVSDDGTSAFGKEAQSDNIFGWIARQAHLKLALDNLTGDFTCRSMNNNTTESPWHLFRTFDDQFWTNNLGIVHSPGFVLAQDAEQYLRIFNATTDESGDHIVVYLQSKVDAQLHARPVYDTYDFEGKGKEIIMDGIGPKQN